MASKIRMNFHSDSEAMINKQINLELFASYTYMAMVSISLFRQWRHQELMTHVSLRLRPLFGFLIKI